MAQDQPKPVKLLAHDEEDLELVSANVQDALVLVGDLAYLRSRRRFLVTCNRFMWTGGMTPMRDRGHWRSRALLRVEHVLKAKAHGIPQSDASGILELLALRFEKSHPEDPENPAGRLHLLFAREGTLRLDVEFLEVYLSDLGTPWPANAVPSHELD